MRKRQHDRPAPATVWSSAKAATPKPKCACGRDGCCHNESKDLKKDDNLPQAVRNVVRGGGQPLDQETRAYMEPRFGQNFSHIRVHRDTAAAQSARAVDANAFTVGNHVVFDSSTFDSSTIAGRRLIAHELAHTVQQQKGQRSSDHAAEKDADLASKKATAQSTVHGGEEAPAITTEPSGEKRIQRQPKTVDVDKDPPPDPKDEGREKVLTATKQTTGDPGKRAQGLMNLMVTRYFPEYQQRITNVVYDEKEPHVSVDVKDVKAGNKTTQTATIKVGKAYIDGVSEDNLRARITELEDVLLKVRIDKDPNAPRPDLIWKLLKDYFPFKTMRLAGALFDKNLPGLSTEFKSGSTATTPAHTWSGPRLFYGKAFADLPEADQVVRLRAELDQVDKWRVENAQLVEDDLKDPDITMRIRGLKHVDLVSLRDKVKDSKVKEYADSLLSVSTPMEEGLRREFDNTLSTTIGDVKVIVDPDNVGNVSANTRAETPAGLEFSPSQIPPYDYDANNVVSGFPGYKPSINVRVHTTYDAAGSKDFTQGYGKGTTKREKALGATSIRYHEGGHGLDVIRFVKDNPPPQFAGKVGDTVKEFKQKMTDYKNARAAYAVDLQKLNDARNECPGTTIDTFMKAKDPKWKTICP